MYLRHISYRLIDIIFGATVQIVERGYQRCYGSGKLLVRLKVLPASTFKFRLLIGTVLAFVPPSPGASVTQPVGYVCISFMYVYLFPLTPGASVTQPVGATSIYKSLYRSHLSVFVPPTVLQALRLLNLLELGLVMLGLTLNPIYVSLYSYVFIHVPSSSSRRFCYSTRWSYICISYIYVICFL